MSSTTVLLLAPDNKALTSDANSFVSNWADKRSMHSFSISVVLRGTNNTQGTLTLEASNVVEMYGGTYGLPSPAGGARTGDPDDAAQLATTLAISSGTSAAWTVTTGVSQAVNQSVTTVYQFTPIYPVGCRWVRVRYKATTSSAGITASVYFSGPHTGT